VKSLNVLITAASRRVPLVQAFRRALRHQNVSGSVIATDVNSLSPAVHVAHRAYRVPLSTDPSYLDELEIICEAESIGLLVPTIDDELEMMGRAAERFRRLGVIIASSDERSAAICNDKFETCLYLRAHGVAAAASYLRDTLPPDVGLPLFIKPRFGRGSVGAHAVKTRRELDFFLDYVPDPVVQEYLPGAEFTIDLLCDFEGRPLSVVPRQRVVIRSGVIDRGRTVYDESLIDLAIACARVLKFRGPVNIQCRHVNGRPVVFEINPRFSGGIPLTIAAGADFPRLLVELALGREVEPQIGAFTPELWMTSFESSLFLDRNHLDVLASVEPLRHPLEEVA
jgi:carbamoyl-phosphate synthase large subunit